MDVASAEPVAILKIENPSRGRSEFANELNFIVHVDKGR
jgi:hypothetical protein